MKQYIAVFIPAGSPEEAEKISRGLVEQKLAFCVQALPSIQSTYYWDNKICVDEEILLIAKTQSGLFDSLEKWVRENHSYDVPEVVAIPIIKGSAAYLKCIDDWVN